MGLHAVAMTHYSLHSHIKPAAVQLWYIMILYIWVHIFGSGGSGGMK
jgi:hypothetical protein